MLFVTPQISSYPAFNNYLEAEGKTISSPPVPNQIKKKIIIIIIIIHSLLPPLPPLFVPSLSFPREAVPPAFKCCSDRLSDSTARAAWNSFIM